MEQMEVQKDLGQMLLEEGIINQQQLDAARASQKAQEKPIGRVLVDMGIIADEAKINFLHKKLGLEIVDISQMSVSDDILKRLSRSYAEKHRCVPILIEEGQLVVAMEDPTDIVVLDEIKAETGMDPLPVLAPLRDIDAVLEQYPGLTQAQVDALQDHVRAPRWWRILHPVFFLLVMSSPLWGFFGLVKHQNNWFAKWALTQPSGFEVALYLSLGWALWAILTWEADGLILESRKKAS